MPAYTTLMTKIKSVFFNSIKLSFCLELRYIYWLWGWHFLVLSPARHNCEFFSQFQISPRLALKHRRADGCVGISFCYLLFTHLSFTFPLCSSLVALQTWAVYSQRARCLTCWGSVGSLESFWHLFADMRRRHKDCHARMQPTRVSSPFLCSHACLLDLVSKVSVP